MMKKIITAISIAILALASVSCEKFPHEGTATESLAGNWWCSIYASDGSQWVEEAEAEFQTYNTALNVPTEMWIDDFENYWGTKAKIDCDAAAASFGKKDAEYLDIYNDVHQKIWDGKVTPNGAVAPGSRSTCDKIEFFISYEDDHTPYGTTYYVVGYRRTGFPEDDEVCIWDWPLPAIQ